MKIKVKLFDKEILKTYFAILSAVSVLTSLIFIFVTIPDNLKAYIGIGFVILMVIIYFLLWIYANYIKRVNLTINNSNLVVKFGDIFREEGLKVIAFNEYFDTQVDEEVIASTSLNGKFINEHVKDIGALDKEILESQHLSSRTKDKNIDRIKGKKQKYKLGSIFKCGDYLLTAFSKFDENNRAFLTMTDYITCLLNFWNEVDIVYANRSVVVPLLGTGITRFDCTISEQEKLELLLWSFKVSQIKFTYPANVTIIIHKSVQDKINFYKLKGIE